MTSGASPRLVPYMKPGRKKRAEGSGASAPSAIRITPEKSASAEIRISISAGHFSGSGGIEALSAQCTSGRYSSVPRAFRAVRLSFMETSLIMRRSDDAKLLNCFTILRGEREDETGTRNSMQTRKNETVPCPIQRWPYNHFRRENQVPLRASWIRLARMRLPRSRNCRRRKGNAETEFTIITRRRRSRKAGKRSKANQGAGPPGCLRRQLLPFPCASRICLCRSSSRASGLKGLAICAFMPAARQAFTSSS